MRAILIGRHRGSFPPEIEVVRQMNIIFPAKAEEARAILEDLATDAEAEGIEAILFQAIPNQVAMALPTTNFNSIKVGAVINIPGERLSEVRKDFYAHDPTGSDWRSDIAEAVLFVNPQAKVFIDPMGITVEVDPPMRFEFSHIEWLRNVK